MPVTEEWLQPTIIQIVWAAPIRADDLRIGFENLVHMLDSVDHKIHLLFEITGAGHVPAQAPVHAIRSGFLTHRNTDKVVVVGRDVVPQILAQVANNVTNRNILFFPVYEVALNYLNSE